MAADQTHEYHRGEMDIHEQERTYHSFLVLSKWGSLALCVGILFFSMLFAAGVPFLGAAATAFVVLVVGIMVLRDKKTSTH
jgi:hypothetical protein